MGIYKHWQGGNQRAVKMPLAAHDGAGFLVAMMVFVGSC